MLHEKLHTTSKSPHAQKKTEETKRKTGLLGLKIRRISGCEPHLTSAGFRQRTAATATVRKQPSSSWDGEPPANLFLLTLRFVLPLRTRRVRGGDNCLQVDHTAVYHNNYFSENISRQISMYQVPGTWYVFSFARLLLVFGEKDSRRDSNIKTEQVAVG